MTIKEASVNINNSDLITSIKSAIVCTNTKDTYSAGFRNGLRYVIALLTDEEPKYEDAKTGHWIDTTNTIGFPRCECSECNSESGAIWMKYCPNCGAKMEGR